MQSQYDRRAFLTAVSAGAGASLLVASRFGCNKQPENRVDEITLDPIDNVRIGFVGIGRRGTNLFRQLLRLEGCQITAVCDVIPERVERAQRMVEEKGLPKPTGYTGGATDYRRLCEQEDLDIVITATPWKMHAPVCIAALQAGKHAATEVPGAVLVEECWQMVEESEKAHKHCVLLENYCYFREVMCVLNMIRQGVFGDPMHVYAGYQKDSLYYAINADGTLTFSGEGHRDAVGNIYPTHHGGPSAKWMDVNRGDAFDYLVSMGSYAKAFNMYGLDHFGPNHPLSTTKFNEMADISNTMIHTKQGRSIHLILDTKSPRPYRSYFRLQASKGIYEHIEKRVHIHKLTNPLPDPNVRAHPKRTWEPLSNYYEQYEHPLWRDVGLKADPSDHGGSDYLELYRLVRALRTGTYPDIDVYDLAAWSCIIELSEISAENRSKTVDIPDFTRGAWKTRKPLPITGA